MSITTYWFTPTGVSLLKTKARTFDELTQLLPRGVYTTFTTTHGGTRVVGFSRHLDRLFFSLQAEGIHTPITRSDLRRFLSDWSGRTSPEESRFRILISFLNGNIYTARQNFTPPPQIIYINGVRAITVNYVRDDPEKKDSTFIEQSRREREIVGNEIYEVLLTKNGHIYEGMTSNFYAIKEEKPQLINNKSPRGKSTLITARNGILHGVTRRIVLRLAQEQGLTRIYRAPGIDEPFKEAFITSSSRGIVPVVSIDGIPVGEGGVGDWTRRLITAYESYVNEHSELMAPSSIDR